MTHGQSDNSMQRPNIGLLLMLVIGLVGIYLILFGGSPTQVPPAPKPDPNRMDGNKSDVIKGPGFVELIYEHDVAPFGKAKPASQAPGKSLNGFIFRPGTNTLYSCTPGVKPKPDIQLIVGQRIHNHFDLHNNVFQQLSEGGDWEVAEDPAPSNVIMFGPTFWLRLPVKLSVSREGQNCVVGGFGQTVALAPGESRQIWSTTRTFSPNEYAAAVAEKINAGREKKIEISAEALEAKLPLQDDKLTLHARVVAIYHGPVRFSSINPLVVRDEGIDALKSGEFERALTRIETCLEVLPYDELLLDLRQQAQRGKDGKVKIYKITGTVSIPQGATIKPKSWVGIRRPDEPADHSRDISSIEDGAFSFRVASGPYVLTAYLPGFKPVSQTINVQDHITIKVDLTADDQR